ncbi:MAG: heme ABC transporter ATP-binding protein [Halobacteriaceae archaeon]
MTLSVDELRVGYGDETVLDGISLTVEAGELVGLVGPNGAGKTTLVRTLLGALEPDAGTVELAGAPVSSLSSRAASQRVAAVPQSASLTFSFTVREVVELGRHPQRPRLGADPDPDAVDRAMERTEVAHLADRPVDEISGGERQRTLLARALAQQTPGMVFDEPTASLDVNHQVRTLELIADLAAEGRAVLAAIHDLDLAARYCDRLVLLSEGTVTAAGTPEAVLDSDTLETAFGTRAVVTRDPLTDAPVVTAMPNRTGGQSGCVHVLGVGSTTAATLGRLRAAGFTVTAGVLPAEGRAATTAEALDIECVTAPAFTEEAPEARRRASALVRDADVTIVVPSPGLQRGPNAGLTAEARRLLVVETDAGDKSAIAARRATARTVSPDRIVEAVTEARSRSAVSPPAEAGQGN